VTQVRATLVLAVRARLQSCHAKGDAGDVSGPQRLGREDLKALIGWLVLRLHRNFAIFPVPQFELIRPVSVENGTQLASASVSREPRIVTTSWDDADPADLKLADLLSSRELTATFYVPIGYDQRPVLRSGELRELATRGFEIGGHGLSHRVLTRLQPDGVAREVRGCKDRLEEILSKRVEMFCYPKGRCDSTTARYVKEAGYEGARTTRLLFTALRFDPFKMPTSLQAYPHRTLAYLKNSFKGGNVRGLYRSLSRPARQGNWVELGCRLFDRVLKFGGVWHLFGHSWEIEKFGLWGDLKEIFDYVSQREGVMYLSNGETLQLARSGRLLSRVEEIPKVKATGASA
jgi:peptidoglycan-N-acetylglucosamine deacetylase